MSQKGGRIWGQRTLGLNPGCENGGPSMSFSEVIQTTANNEEEKGRRRRPGYYSCRDKASGHRAEQDLSTCSGDGPSTAVTQQGDMALDLLPILSPSDYSPAC